MKPLHMLAFDFGASSGRGILGKFDGEKLDIEVIHQFPNGPVEVNGHYYWDILRLLTDMKHGIVKCAEKSGQSLSSIGIDTWGVDYGLLDSSGQLLGNPYHYRDSRTQGVYEETFKRVSKERIFEITGIAFMPFNTIAQLMAMRLQQPDVLDTAHTMLLMPDLLSYFLTGEKASEYTEASTGQLIDARARTWSKELIKALDLPERIFTRIQEPGTIRGNVLKGLGEELRIGSVPVVAVASHDTGSAVAAVPASKNRFAYLSSGTWSLFGTEVTTPVINEKTLQRNFTNEGGVAGTYRLLRNVMGLWIIQECKRIWDGEGQSHGFGELVDMAEKSKPFLALINPDDETFYTPGNMPKRIQEFCQKTGQAIPQTKGEIVRVVLESLALKYRWTMEGLEEIAGHPMDVLHIVGGGSKNNLLNQFTANAIRKQVVCGPTEATAIGNLMVQAQALGQVKNLVEIRQVVRNSFPVATFEPKDTAAWDDAYGKFLKIAT